MTETTDDRHPKAVEFRFATPLESPEWLWMRGAGLGLVGRARAPTIDFDPPPPSWD